jgi:cytosine deaminase
MLDTFVLAVKILQLDYPIGDWIDAATRTPASIMRLESRGVLRPGAPADLIVLRARNYSELLARHQADRVVLRAGRAIDTAPPDYRQLDGLMHPAIDDARLTGGAHRRFGGAPPSRELEG